MTMRSLLPALALILVGTSVAQAACHPLAQGDTAAVIASNQQRLFCLNREAAAASDERQRDMQMRTLNNAITTQNIQRRFDNLPVYQPPRF